MKRTSKELHPLVILLYYMSIIFLTAFLMNPVFLLLSFGGALLMLLCEGIRLTKRDLLFYGILFILLGSMNPLFYHNGRTVLFILNGNPVTAEACVYGYTMAFLMICVLLWCKSLTGILTSEKIVYLFGRISQKLALLCSMILRFVPMYIRQSRRIRETQRAVGLFGEETLWERIRAQLHIFSAMTTWALEHSMETADSMRARGYGTGRRSLYQSYPVRRRDTMLLFMLGVCLLTVIAGLGQGEFTMQFYPVLRPVPYRAVHGVVYTAYGLMILSVPAHEAMEIIKWNYLQSKI